MKRTLKLRESEAARLQNIIDMGLDFSAMMRLFEKGSKKRLRDNILGELPHLFAADSEQQFKNFHSNFCEWGILYIVLAEKKKNNRVVKPKCPASYGQIAKTLDVVLKVVIHYCQMPEPGKSCLIAKWLNAAVDTKMMAFLKPEYSSLWPTTIQDVDREQYEIIQGAVRNFIEERHNGDILPVEFDDIYWEAFNRGEEQNNQAPKKN